MDIYTGCYSINRRLKENRTYGRKSISNLNKKNIAYGNKILYSIADVMSKLDKTNKANPKLRTMSLICPVPSGGQLISQ